MAVVHRAQAHQRGARLLDARALVGGLARRAVSTSFWFLPCSAAELARPGPRRTRGGCRGARATRRAALRDSARTVVAWSRRRACTQARAPAPARGGRRGSSIERVAVALDASPPAPAGPRARRPAWDRRPAPRRWRAPGGRSRRAPALSVLRPVAQAVDLVEHDVARVPLALPIGSMCSCQSARSVRVTPASTESTKTMASASGRRCSVSSGSAAERAVARACRGS